MKITRWALLLVWALVACGGRSDDAASRSARRDEMKVVTYNLWHGLNPTSNLRFAEHETAADREARLQGFFHFARLADPDLLFLQEVNPAPSLSARVARELGYDYTYTIDNAGIKLGSLGLPTNLRSGLAILAKKGLHLKPLGGRKLSGPFGFIHRCFALQTKEFRYALAAEIRVNERRVLLMDVHLHHGPEADDEIQAALARMVADGRLTDARRQEIIATFNLASQRRRGELEAALRFAEELGFDDAPMLFAGDFNASPGTPELRWLKDAQQFRSVTDDDDPSTRLLTWDHARNPNTHFFADFVPVHDFEPAVMAVLQPIVVRQSKRLDYIFTRGFEGFLTPAQAGLFAEAPHQGRFCSDHFGLQALLRKPQ